MPVRPTGRGYHVAGVRDVVVAQDGRFAVPAVGDQVPALDGAEVDTGGVAGPVLGVRAPGSPVVAVEQRNLVGVEVGPALGWVDRDRRRRRVGLPVLGQRPAGLGQLPQCGGVAVPPPDARLFPAVVVLVPVGLRAVLGQADLRALQQRLHRVVEVAALRARGDVVLEGGQPAGAVGGLLDRPHRGFVPAGVHDADLPRSSHSGRVVNHCR